VNDVRADQAEFARLHDMSEGELLAFIVQRCDDLGLLWFHSFDSKRDKLAGWPDLVIVGHGIMFRELKSESGSVTLEQQRFGKAIRAAGGHWSVWRPRDLDDGRIQRELRDLAFCPLATLLAL
jgi:hypothetical protein